MTLATTAVTSIPQRRSVWASLYRLESGKSPVEEFLDNLIAKQAKKVVWVLNIVEEHINMFLLNILKKWLTQIIFGKSGLILDQIYFESSVFLMLLKLLF